MPRKAESLRIPAPQLPSYDRDQANKLIDRAFDDHGWLITDELGGTAHDIDKLRHSMFVAFTTNHAVTSVAAGRSRRSFNDLVQERAVTKYGLYVELFPNGPAAQRAPLSEEEAEAKEHIAKYLWGLCTPTNRRAWLQKELGDSGLIVVEAKVYSEDATVPPQPGRYVTNVEQAMLDFLEHKVLEDVRKKVTEAEEWLTTLMLRNPEIALPAARKAKAALKSAVESALHANPTYVRDTLALNADSNGSAAVDDDDESFSDS